MLRGFARRLRGRGIRERDWMRRPSAGHMRAIVAGIALASAIFLGVQAPAFAGTPYVDGVSDQSLPYWDGGFSGSYFGSFFQHTWVGVPASHVKFARYIVSWNLFSTTFPERFYYERTEFEQWLTDVESIGLTPDIALTTYHGEYPVGPSEYKEQLEKILEHAKSLTYTIPYVEAWNEPNAQGNVSATRAAEYANEANTSCKAFWGCTVVLGNMFDSGRLVEYEQNYEANLDFNSGIWGVHPYEAVENETTSNVQAFKEHLPAGAKLWFTEVAVHQCVYKGKEKNERTPQWQAERAKWLTDTLIPTLEPENVFYYEYLFKNNEAAPCSEGQANDSLYSHGSDPNAPDEPKPAAAYIYNGHGFPWGYTGGASNVTGTEAQLTASVYPGGVLNAKYRFEYGPTTSYGSNSGEGSAGSAEGYAAVMSSIGGLTPGQTYHYRVVAYNSEGSSYGEDKTFTTPLPPEATTETSSELHETQATLNGSVNPRGFETHYYFQYGLTTSYGAQTKAVDVGSGTSRTAASTTIGELYSGVVYHYRIVATNAGGTTYGNDSTFITPEPLASSTWAVKYPLLEEEQASFVGSSDRLCYWRNNGGWHENCLVGAETTSPSSQATALAEPNTSESKTFFVGSMHQVCYWGYNREWYENCLAGTETAVENSALAALNGPTAKEGRAFFIGSSGRLCYWGFNVEWHENCLEGSEPVSSGSGLAALPEPSTNEMKVFFVGRSGRLCYWGYNHEWHENCLVGTEAARENSSLSITSGPASGEQRLFFIGSAGRVCYWGYNREWHENCLVGPEAPQSDSGLTSTAEPESGDMKAFFTGQTGHLCMWRYSGEWSELCLASTESVREGSTLATLRHPQTAEVKVFFVGSTQRLCYWGYNREWYENCLEGTETVAGKN